MTHHQWTGAELVRAAEAIAAGERMAVVARRLGVSTEALRIALRRRRARQTPS